MAMSYLLIGLFLIPEFLLFIFISTGRLLTEDPDQRLGSVGAKEVTQTPSYMFDPILNLLKNKIYDAGQATSIFQRY